MSEMIQQRKLSEKVERFDLFSSLLAANDEETSDVKLVESELIGDRPETWAYMNAHNFNPGNIFIFLVAGHEVHNECFRQPTQLFD